LLASLASRILARVKVTTAHRSPEGQPEHLLEKQAGKPATEQGPRAAVEGVELPGGSRRFVLFTTEDVSLRDANPMLQEVGFRGVMRLDEVRRVESIPVLGTGKTDYKALRAQVGAS
jgi:hypothetical protein